MLYVPGVQISRISRSPFSSPSSNGGASLLFAADFPLTLAFLPHTAWHVKILGLSHKCVGVNALPENNYVIIMFF